MASDARYDADYENAREMKETLKLSEYVAYMRVSHANGQSSAGIQKSILINQ